MNKEIKELLEKVIPVLKENREIYNSDHRIKFRDGNKFTVLSLMELASNHLFDNNPDLFGITENEGWKIRSYFENPDNGRNGYNIEYQRAVEDMIVDLYRTFPNVFEGESRGYLQTQNDLSRLEGVPLF